jgi:TPR repeat protein
MLPSRNIRDVVTCAGADRLGGGIVKNFQRNVRLLIILACCGAAMAVMTGCSSRYDEARSPGTGNVRDFTKFLVAKDRGQPSSIGCQKPDDLATPHIALVIGESKYEQYRAVGADWSPLPITRQDAIDMAHALACRGFRLVGGGPQIDVEEAAFRDDLRALADQARGRQAVLIVYVSAHGLREGSKTQVAPTDVPRPMPGFINDMSGFISVQDIDRELHASAPQISLIILDTCRDAPFSPAPIDAGVGELSPETILSLATAPGEEAPTLNTETNSYFTAALLQRLSEGDGKSTIRNFLQDVSFKVGSLDLNQHPVYRFGKPEQYGNIPAATIFGGNAPPTVTAEDDRGDDPSLTAVQFAALSISCNWSDNYLDTASPPVQTSYSPKTKSSVDDPENTVTCARLAKRLLEEGVVPDGSDQFRAKIKALLRQAADQGNAAAAYEVWVVGSAGPFGFWKIQESTGDLSPENRVQLEYLDRAAEAGFPVAMYFAGVARIPRANAPKYYFILPESYNDGFVKGRRYLEAALDAGIADAGWRLALISQQHLTGFPTQPERYREYAERALKAEPWAMQEKDVNYARFDLANDYMTTAPINKTRALELYREVVASADDEFDGQSIRGLASWEVCYDWRTNHFRETGASAEGHAACLAAAELGIPHAYDYVGSALARGLDGFPKDPVKGAEYLRLATNGVKPAEAEKNK